MEAYIGEIRILPIGRFVTSAWLPCNGQLLPINDASQALFTLIGTSYGGDGTTNFALPNLQGVAPVGAGAGPGLTPRALGSSWGRETVFLASAHLPVHSHAFKIALPDPKDDARLRAPVQTGTDDTTASLPAYLSKKSGDPDNATFAARDPANAATMANGMILPAIGSAALGSVAPHNNVQPWYAFNYYICVDGIYPAPPTRPG